MVEQKTKKEPKKKKIAKSEYKFNSILNSWYMNDIILIIF